MSPTRIEEKEEIESIKETNLSLLDSGATATVWTRPTNIRSEDTTKIFHQAAEREFGRLLSHQAVRPHRIINNGQLTTMYARATTEYKTARSEQHQSRITAGGDRYQTVDISNEFLYCPTHAINL